MLFCRMHKAQIYQCEPFNFYFYNFSLPNLGYVIDKTVNKVRIKNVDYADGKNTPPGKKFKNA